MSFGPIKRLNLCGSLAMPRCNVRCNMLSYISQSIVRHFKRSVDTPILQKVELTREYQTFSPQLWQNLASLNSSKDLPWLLDVYTMAAYLLNTRSCGMNGSPSSSSSSSPSPADRIDSEIRIVVLLHIFCMKICSLNYDANMLPKL